MSNLDEVGGDYVEGVRAVRNFAGAVKLLLGGLLIAGIGISQAIFGWVGQGFVYRVLYPIPLVGLGLVLAWLGTLALKGEPPSEGEDDPAT